MIEARSMWESLLSPQRMVLSKDHTTALLTFREEELWFLEGVDVFPARASLKSLREDFSVLAERLKEFGYSVNPGLATTTIYYLLKAFGHKAGEVKVYYFPEPCPILAVPSPYPGWAVAIAPVVEGYDAW